MRRTLLFLNLLIAALVVSPFVSRPVTYRIDERFTIKDMPTSGVLAQLNIVPNVVNQSAYLEVNTVNHISKQIVIQDIVFDYDALYYMLYLREDLGQYIDDYLSGGRPLKEVLVLSELKEYIKRRDLREKERFFRFEKNIDLFEKAGDFFVQLVDYEQELLGIDLFTNRSLRIDEVRFYEDFDEEEMLVGIYGLYSVYDQDTYYLEGETCQDFYLGSRLDEEEKVEFISKIEDEDYVEEEGCYLQHFKKLDHNLSFEIEEEKRYPHANSFVFEYQSHVSKPYARLRLVFDHFYEEKLMISTENLNFKISKEASDYRNQYNVEPVEVYGDVRYIPVDLIYPHRLIIEEKERWFYTSSNYFHQMLEDNLGNVKYRKDLRYYDAYYGEVMLGGLELIYDRAGYVEYDPLTTFTFNYGIGDLEHYVKDVFPFLLWGTGVENRNAYSIVERFIWDKDRFTLLKQGKRLEKRSLRDYYENSLADVIIGSEIPIDILEEIDRYYQNTR